MARLNSTLGKAIVAGLLAGLATMAGSAEARKDERIAWFRDAKFGIFIHWGVGSVQLDTEGKSRTEIIELQADQFNPVKFDAGEWVRVIEDAGAKYVTFTTKHHNGFCNWDSALTDWDVMDATPFRRDALAELARASKAAGLRLGLYYSIADWHHPEYDPKYSNRGGFHFNPNPGADIHKYFDYMHGQIAELITKYDPSLFWFDGTGGLRGPERTALIRPQRLADLIHEHGAVINSRICDDDKLRYADYLTMGDNMVPAGNVGVDFETAGTMNDSWHYDPEDKNWKSAGDLLARLVDVVGKGGNYLLNIGPTDEGIIPAASVSRLKEMGAWLRKNGEAIYDATAGPYPFELEWGSMTQRAVGKNTRLYLNVVDWPHSGLLKLYGLENRVIRATLLATGEPVSTASEFNMEAGLMVHTLQLPNHAPDPHVSVVALDIEGAASMEQSLMQHGGGAVTFDGFQGLIHDIDGAWNSGRRAIELREFTTNFSADGVGPGRGLTIQRFGKKGQSLSWDFKLVEPGTHRVEVVHMIRENEPWAADGRMRATIGGKSIEGDLKETRRTANPRMPPQFTDSIASLGTIAIQAPGTYTLKLEISSDFSVSNLAFRGVMLSPVR